MFNGQSILITGGTGSLGRAVVRLLLSEYPEIKLIRVYSRDELKHQQMKLKFQDYDTQLEYMIGDVRDYDRLEEAIDGIDIVIHAAAMKQVGACEANPNECFKTNVIGTQNLIKAVNHTSVSKVLFISSDKAVEPVSVYGNSKQAGEKLFISNTSENQSFSIVRLGNLIGSSGSVIPIFKHLKSSGKLPITDLGVTRFCGLVDEGASTVMYALKNMVGGEVFVPKWNSFSVLDVAEVVASGCNYDIIGLKKHEKKHEKLIGDQETDSVFENRNFWVITKEKITVDVALDYYDAIKVGIHPIPASSQTLLSLESLELMINVTSQKV